MESIRAHEADSTAEDFFDLLQRGVIGVNNLTE